MFINSYKISVLFGAFSIPFLLFILYLTFKVGNIHNKLLISVITASAIIISCLIKYYKYSVMKISLINTNQLKITFMNNKYDVFCIEDIANIVYCANCVKIIFINGKNYRIFYNNKLFRLNRIDQNIFKCDILKNKIIDNRLGIGDGSLPH